MFVQRTDCQEAGECSLERDSEMSKPASYYKAVAPGKDRGTVPPCGRDGAKRGKQTKWHLKCLLQAAFPQKENEGFECLKNHSQTRISPFLSELKIPTHRQGPGRN